MLARLLAGLLPLPDAPRLIESMEQLYREAWRRAVREARASC